MVVHAFHSDERDGYHGGVRFHLASLVEEFRRHAAETAVVAYRGNRRYATTYGELAQLAGRSAAELERRGMAVGDRVVFWGENSAECAWRFLRLSAARSDLQFRWMRQVQPSSPTAS